LSGGGIVRSDAAGDLLQVIEREGRKDYFVIHLATRRRASSNSTPEPVSSERTPAPITASISGISTVLAMSIAISFRAGVGTAIVTFS
jgi:hypothetical protein